ncbi:hypothetical protein EVAR_74468_1 [Eumeta japonica]|uniref:Uncharacterized protein n=1 Tax=Eumeta variegata TaxID=151549 RepID=A0A4C1TBB4_EUMVA|nr:hypothetical protein EVAR_74468_1 [Eumeta japonica]
MYPDAPKSQFGSPPRPPEVNAYRRPSDVKAVTNWLKVLLLLEVTNTSILNSILDKIETVDEIDHAIGTLTKQIRTVVENSSKVVSVADNLQKLPEDI